MAAAIDAHYITPRASARLQDYATLPRAGTVPDLLEELDRVLRYPKLQRYYADEERTRFVALLMALSQVVELAASIPRICRDPDDDRVIACAVVGEADVVVIGDRDLLALERAGRILIQSATQFLEMLE